MAVYIVFSIIGWCMVILAFFLNLHWHKKDTNKQIKALQAYAEKLQMQIDEMHEGIFGNGEQKPHKWHEVVMLEHQKNQRKKG